MAAFGFPNNAAYYGSGTNMWISTTTGVTWPNQPIYIAQPATDWERAAVKAEPDDEFSWLRKRVREVEEMAFA